MKKLIVLVIAFLLPWTLLAQVTSQGVPTYSEGTPHQSGQKGIMPLCVRTDTPASSANLTGEYATINCDALGGQYVNISGMSPTTAAAFAPLDVTLPAGIGAGYASAVDLPNGTKVVVLDNQTNGDVMVSMDGGATDTAHMKAGDVLTYDLAADGLVTTADVQVKDGTTASTTGSFYVYSYK